MIGTATVIANIENTYIGLMTWDCGSQTYFFSAKAAIDDDGTGPAHGDPDEQPATSYRPYLNADIDRYIVLPPLLFTAVSPMVLGCKAIVFNNTNGKFTEAVVGDIGPHNKIGEISIATANAIGVPSSPTTGGVDDHVIFYQIFPGIPATSIDGRQYVLQAYRS